MAETLTTNYGWTKPDPGASANTWGTTLNATTDKIDAQVAINQQAGIPVGAMTMWGGATPPANWLLCNGQSLATVGTYAALFAIIGYAYGGSGANFNVPNLSQKFPMGASGGTLGGTGGLASVTLDATMIPAHTHTAQQAAHNHPGTYQDVHNHPDPGHTHPASQAAHAHNITETGTFGFGVGATAPPNPLTNSGGGTRTLTTDVQQPAVSIGYAGCGLGNAQPAIHTDAQQPAVTVNANTGGGGAHENRPPFLQVNFIIKFA